MADSHFLQICPHDTPPFADICASYARAALRNNWQPRTLVLGPRTSTVASGEVGYLDADDLADTRAVARALAQALNDGPWARPLLTVCHRYRSLRVALKAGLRPDRLVTVVHEFGFFDRWQRRLLSKTSARSVLFAGVSAAVTETLRPHALRTATIENALPLETARRALLDRAAAREALGVAPHWWQNRTVLVWLGRLHPKKRPELGIEVLREASTRTERPLGLVYIGDGEEHGRLEQRAGSLPVLFLGFKPNAGRLLKAFDGLLMTSDAREAFGMVALEALLAGVPVVSSRAPGPVAVLGEAGRYFDLGRLQDAAAHVAAIAEGEGVEGYAAVAARMAARFDIERLAERLASVAAYPS